MISPALSSEPTGEALSIRRASASMVRSKVSIERRGASSESVRASSATSRRTVSMDSACTLARRSACISSACPSAA